MQTDAIKKTKNGPSLTDMQEKSGKVAVDTKKIIENPTKYALQDANMSASIHAKVTEIYNSIKNKNLYMLKVARIRLLSGTMWYS